MSDLAEKRTVEAEQPPVGRQPEQTPLILYHVVNTFKSGGREYDGFGEAVLSV